MIKTGYLIHLHAPESENFPFMLCSLPMHPWEDTDPNQVLSAVLWKGYVRLGESTPNVAEQQFSEKEPGLDKNTAGVLSATLLRRPASSA